MDPRSLTIILPVHNAESCLEPCIQEVLELASELTRDFSILVVDDGSTDATSEIAAELATRFPQVSTCRQRHRRGLGPTLETVRSDVVIMHDGTSPVDPNEIRKLWHDCVASPARQLVGPILRTTSRLADLADLGELPATHRMLEQAHRRILGFQLLTLQRDAVATSAAEDAAAEQRQDGPHRPARSGVGQIPRWPRPKFLQALANFTFGE